MATKHPTPEKKSHSDQPLPYAAWAEDKITRLRRRITLLGLLLALLLVGGAYWVSRHPSAAVTSIGPPTPWYKEGKFLLGLGIASGFAYGGYKIYGVLKKGVETHQQMLQVCKAMNGYLLEIRKVLKQNKIG